MKLPLSLIKQFISVRVSPYELAEKLTQAGVKVEEVEKVGSDFVFSFEITTNRGDLLGALGIAREISAIYGIPIQHPGKLTRRVKIQNPVGFSIGIQNLKDCPRYLGALLAITIGPSPDWLKTTLTLCGLRPVNNIVDITNYLMLKYGQPAHAFDADKITLSTNSELIVRRARKGEGIITLDHEDRKLDPNHLVIADERGPIALAGVMGGQVSEVSSRTKAIILEVATFDPKIVRRAEIDFNLRTESAQRFEKGLDPDLPGLAFSEAQKLLEESAQAKLLAGPIDEKRLPKPTALTLDPVFVERILGVKIPPRKIGEILRRLGIEVKLSESLISGKIPSFRKDLAEEIDLVEEVARIYGYQNLPSTLPSGEYPDLPALGTQKRYEALKQVKQTLSGLGISEAYTFSLTSQQKTAVKVVNPLSEENAYLRVSLLPGLLEALKENLPNFERVGLFEIGKIFPKETLMLAAVLGGGDSFLDLKGILEEFLKKLSLPGAEFAPAGRNTAKISVGKALVGTAGFLESDASSYFEINLEKLLPLLSPKTFQPYSTYPPVIEDFSFILPPRHPFGKILDGITSVSPLITEVSLADSFDTPEGSSVTVRVIYQARERSLSRQDIKPLREKILLLLKNSGAKLR